MQDGIYGAIAPYYDAWNSDVDYAAWADGAEAVFARHFRGKVKDIMDLGCGSGRMAIELAGRGYGVVGVDSSPEMLSVAHVAAERAGVQDRILWLEQDITAFELYGTVEAAVSCLDTLNHLLTYAELRRTLSLLHNYLVPGGLLLFDLNSRRKFETRYADNVYTAEQGEDVILWQNFYRKRSHIADFYITLFQRTRDGTYRRTDALTRERMYPTSCILRELRAHGFTPLSVGDSPYTDAYTEDAERLFFVARCEK